MKNVSFVGGLMFVVLSTMVVFLGEQPAQGGIVVDVVTAPVRGVVALVRHHRAKNCHAEAAVSSCHAKVEVSSCHAKVKAEKCHAKVKAEKCHAKAKVSACHAAPVVSACSGS